MAEDTHRSVSIRRTATRQYVATNARGGELRFGEGSGGEFTPVELLLTAIAGCSAVDVDYIAARRAEPESFDVEAHAEKIRDESGNRLEDIEVVFRVSFPAGDDGDAARAVLPDAVAKSHDRLCTVSRTVELPSPVTMHAE
ncbi:putative OsmC-like protein [Haloactinopolyspora alba]|uniref:Putative OsmC-like protein n=1 Tax=Haloactinopolyspora alba TaxID=648780 RepID=A0A2P8EGA7_9ACTN|nr:OsmC family protein [Haloactinopolyspora alba]PSL08482.1 putative OsmC-like protein [Haloactinopolyspora alba]